MHFYDDALDVRLPTSMQQCVGQQEIEQFLIQMG